MRKILHIFISISILHANIEDGAVHGTDSINYAGGTTNYIMLLLIGGLNHLKVFSMKYIMYI